MGIILRTQKMAAGHAAAAFINIASFFVLRHVFFAETFSTVSTHLGLDWPLFAAMHGAIITS
jgi:hypothetical protein